MGPDCALGKMSGLGNLRAIRSSQAIRKTELGGVGPEPPLCLLQVTAIHDLPVGTFDISLTSATRPTIKVISHGRIWLCNVFNEMNFASFCEACAHKRLSKGHWHKEYRLWNRQLCCLSEG